MAEAESATSERWRTSSSSSSSSSVPCRFYVLGMCREGDRCKYFHDDSLLRTLDEDQSKNVIKDKVTKSERNEAIQDSTGECPSKCSSNDNIGSDRNDESPATPKTNAREADDNTLNNNNLTEGQANLEPVICKYFQQGCCMFGDNCFNRHEIVADSADSSSRCSHSLESTPSTSVDGPSTSEQDSSLSMELPSSSLKEIVESEAEERPLNQVKTSELTTKLRVNAPEFIPGRFACSPPAEPVADEVDNPKEVPSGKTWAQIVNSTAGNGVPSPFSSLCPYAEAGDCPYGDSCSYIHGDSCEFCGNACLHPTNEEQRKSHTDECIKQHEREMELAFAVARSKDKQCGVCFEVIVDKNPASEQRFGILPNCNHCFCLACIRKWRQAKQFENKIIRACPECRVTSDFVCPSMYWVDTKEEKDKLIDAYKNALSNKQCKYFKQGRGKCPFGNKCFYLHAYPDGTKVDTGPPIRRHRQNADGETDALQLYLWDFLDERDNRWLYSLDDLDLVAFLSGSDDSDASDIEYLL